MVARPQAGSGVRIAELVATLSYAADLGLGQPMAHCMRQTVIALRLGELAGASDRELEATYYLGLMMNVYCHADAAEQAQWFGDDISLKGDGFEMLEMSTPRTISFILRRVSSHGSGVARARRLAAFPVDGDEAGGRVHDHALHARVPVRQGEIGLSTTPSASPSSRPTSNGTAKAIPTTCGVTRFLPARLAQLASPVEVFSRPRTRRPHVAVARRHRGTQFDPAAVDLFCEHAADLLDGLDQASDWDAILDTEPPLSRRVAGADLDGVLEAMADLVNLKSPYLAGHSRGVANLAGEAARVSGQPADAVSTLRRAGADPRPRPARGLQRDLGQASPLTHAESERVRLHPYLTDRMLARVSVSRPSREIAARHHERLDGSGYPRGLTAAGLTPSDRLLAAADAYHAMTEPRPHRAPLDPGRASGDLRAEVIAGRLDGTAVDAVLTAAGHRAPARPACLAGSPRVRWRCSACSPAATRPRKSAGSWWYRRRPRPITSSTSTPSSAFPAVPRRRCSPRSTA